MIVDISLDCVGSQRPHCGTLVRLLRPLSVMFPYSRRVIIVLRRSLYGVVSDGRVLGLFVPLPQAVFQDFPREQAFRWERVLAEYLSQCCVRLVSLTVPKQLDSCSTFHKAVVTSRAFPSHFVSWFYGLNPPQAPTSNVESGSRVERLLFAGGVFLDALLYYQ